MKPEIADRLLTLNRAFYAAVGPEFDATRQNLPPGMVRLLEYAPALLRTGEPLRLLDGGCGNGRFARALEQLGRPVLYTGVDADEWLLQAAQSQTAVLAHVQCRFVAADLAAPGWAAQLQGSFDLIVCLATLHHLPGAALRGRVIADLAAKLAPGGRLAVGIWRFSLSARMAARTVAWEKVGLSPEDVEEGDALLPWDQGVHALRYVHEISEDELRGHATAAGLLVKNTYSADGKEGNLNLYAILESSAQQSEERHSL